MQSDPIVIVGMARTPMGNLLGDLKELTAPALGSFAIAGALTRAGITGEQVSEVLMGCVLPAGQGQAPARQAALLAGIPDSVPCTTINKMCGSGMKAVMMACDSLTVDPTQTIVAGGQESMSNAPYLIQKARSGLRLGHGQLLDHMFIDGLEDAYDKGKLMGVFAENTAAHYGFTRQQQDEFAIRSLTRAQTAAQDGSFAAEITPVTIKTREGERVVSVDENPGKANPAKIPTLKPAFSAEGTVTAANSSSISDGAAALVLMRLSMANQLHLKPLAKIVGYTQHAQQPAWFTTAPVKAIQKLLDQCHWRSDDVDLFEINEAFAVVTMAALKELTLYPDKVNIHGGACALGHPIGASGARILVTLINALMRHHLKKGVASLCIGGGEATAMAIELM